MNDELPNRVAALLHETFRIRTLEAIDASHLDLDDETRKMAAGLLCDEIGPAAVEAALMYILEEFDEILVGSIARTVEVAKLEQALGLE
ncbi:hypothetical protein [Rhodococcus qingshengii]|uniref:hypothetical protein n=1 Tax=Rhodococcus qingshengii TaxID=334542 RepID=UPI00071E3EF5|nr:hypothetical protein [Rhodococcus qingshengii]KSU77158.1 hypothetical protein AS032_14695 [Rhodococcus qingshengii]SCC37615.1 hypothetical protein GA0061093_107164 [Rhodococcus qingshengii]